MRFTIKGAILGAAVGVLFTTTLLWSQCKAPSDSRNFSSLHDEAKTEQNEQQQSRRIPLMANQWEKSEGRDRSLLGMEEIDCVINQESTVSCRKDDSDVFLPFSFIHNYFEVYGRLAVNKEGDEVFEWSHSYSNVFVTPEDYNPLGSYLNFHLFNVEARERVKCVSAAEGIPISTQWKSSGYPYPIQIAQFGLSHYSKNLEQPKARRVFIEDGMKAKAKWEMNGRSDSMSRVFRSDIRTNVMKFSSSATSKRGGVVAKIHAGLATPDMVVLNVWLSLSGSANGSVSVTLRTNEKKSDVFTLVYCLSDKLVEVVDQTIFYGLGSNWSGRFLTRNLLVDLMKGISLSPRSKKLKKKVNKSKFRVMSIELRGRGELTNVSLATHEHVRHFYDAADWLLNNQDDKGGWPIPVQRKVISGLLELESGWYSAMAQGQAISVLVRAAHHSGDLKYIRAAVRASKLFTLDVDQGGIRTHFPGGLPWYEEYPTTPSLFVLNGFMYSLIGLYDLKKSSMAPSNPSGELFDEGMKSLTTLLPLFDTGQGSFYDLRHFTSHIAPNIARWDYHTTHITQLFTLATVANDDADFLRDTATRWREYLVGRRAKHN